ncbi:Uu.00g008140.m01.CDS01 [Anthostomella pinea]|uniref:Uu.00g008140.m01.CDS01 n=1 Tax=Anthostomella pinea TaxID=933095 RepID=A0AAI8YPW8_9PEZI|nr:Uu.00g008140.m01.CDS01 [Anthostomella pinea]
MSSFLKPLKGSGKPGFQIRPRGAGGDRIREVLSQNRIASQRAMSMDPTPPPQPAANSSTQCPNKQCPNRSAPIVEGFCSACGREIDNSNIVAEVQFGETSSGAAMVQGTFVGADQGTTRGMGPGMRRIGGMVGDNKEKTIREAKNMMWGFKSRLKSVSESAIDSAIMIFKLVLGENWLQGRGMDKVVPVCLYTACRREERCDVMLIDFAELVQINVYELGHVFKDLGDIYSFQNNNVRSIIPEDLMMRFAEKLDFGEFTNKVAADATRLCQRMGRDWMVMGRRPSGICGACLLMAARMWNFRRTVKEIVYVVKVTTVTIEQRLDEFTVTESSDLSIEDFLNQEFLESRHDPPSFYRQSKEWQDKKEQERAESGRKRKRVLEDIGDDELDGDATTGERAASQDGSTPTPRLSSATTNMPPPPVPRPPPDVSKLAKVTDFLPRAFDSTENREIVTPFDHTQMPQPAPRPAPASDKDVADGLNAENPTSEEAVDELAQVYGAPTEDAEEAEEAEAEEEVEQDADEEPEPRRRRRGRRNQLEPLLNFDEEWESDEALLEKQINEVISDPHSDAHQKALATAVHLAHIKTQWQLSLLPSRKPNMEEIIGEDEFADDPEVQFCKLAPDEVKIKEDIWMNTNKDWLRKQQEKNYRKQMEDLGPPKRKRNRVKKPRIGEGQLTPASTPGEAAVEAMKKRNTVSKRINYDAITNLFGSSKRRGPGSVASRLDSDTTSNRPSRAGSVFDEGSPRSAQSNTHTPPATQKPAANELGQDGEDEEDEEAADDTYDGTQDDIPEWDENAADEDEDEWF